MVEMAKPIFTIMKGGAEKPFNPFETIELDIEGEDDSRRYMHIRANNIIKTYAANGQVTVSNHFTKLVPCSIDFFSGSAFEKNFHKNTDSIETHYCMEDKDVYLQGTRDS